MKLPLQVQHQWICDADGRDMLLMDTCSGEDMREIVRRCNAYDAMRELLDDAYLWSDHGSNCEIYFQKACNCWQLKWTQLKSALAMTEAK